MTRGFPEDCSKMWFREKAVSLEKRIPPISSPANNGKLKLKSDLIISFTKNIILYCASNLNCRKSTIYGKYTR